MPWKYSMLSDVRCFHCGKQFSADVFYDNHFDKNGRRKLSPPSLEKMCGGPYPAYKPGSELIMCPYCENFMTAQEPYDGFYNDPKYKKIIRKTNQKFRKNFFKFVFERFNLFLKGKHNARTDKLPSL